jgi:hypothetical protein
MSDEPREIDDITIPTAQGVGTYTIGRKHTFTEQVIYKIVKSFIKVDGDPYDHYLGYSEEGDLIFSINCLIPCVVTYKLEQGVKN